MPIQARLRTGLGHASLSHSGALLFLLALLASMLCAVHQHVHIHAAAEACILSPCSCFSICFTCAVCAWVFPSPLSVALSPSPETHVGDEVCQHLSQPPHQLRGQELHP